MKTHRLARVAEAIREVASETILFELRDPRVKMVTVTRAEVSGDLQHAKVYVSIMGSEREQQLFEIGLGDALPLGNLSRVHGALAIPTGDLDHGVRRVVRALGEPHLARFYARLSSTRCVLSVI